MKKNLSLSIAELFDDDGNLRRDRLINAGRLIERCEVITVRDVMTGGDVAIFGSEILRAYRPNSGRVPITLLIECDLDGDEFSQLRDAVAGVKGLPCEYTPLD